VSAESWKKHYQSCYRNVWCFILHATLARLKMFQHVLRYKFWKHLAKKINSYRPITSTT